MATKRDTSASKTKQSDTVTNGTHARYINPHTDFGFKKLFGSEANIDVLQELLPVLLRKDCRFKSLRYLNPEQLGRSPLDRNAVYDIYCETDDGEKETFIKGTIEKLSMKGISPEEIAEITGTPIEKVYNIIKSLEFGK